MILAAFVAASIIFSGAVAAIGVTSVQISPDMLVSDQVATFKVKLDGSSDHDHILHGSAYWSGGSCNVAHKTFTTSPSSYTFTIKSRPGGPGKVKYKFYVEWDRFFLFDDVYYDTFTTREYRVFSGEEVSDKDRDNLMYYVEVEKLNTDPNNPDTDGDGKRDDVDDRPTTPEGSISISTTPTGVSVRMDGRSIGTTPITMKDVISDTHTLTLTKDGYKSKTVPFVLSAGGAENIDEVLEQLTGSIQISSNPPGASIYIDGVIKGNSPETVPGVLPGSYTVRLVKEEYDDYTKSGVNVKADQTTSVNAVLVPSDAKPPDMRIETEIIDHNYNGVLEEGECIKVMYGASDESGVTSIKLMIDGQMVASQNAGGDYSMDSQPLSTGTHTISVASTDSRGNSGSDKKQITVEPTGPSIAFAGTRTEIIKGEDAVFTLSVANPIGNPLAEVQLMLKPPSGVSVTSSHFVKAGSGIYTATQNVRSGKDVRSIEVCLTSDQVGTHEIKSEVHYQFEGRPKSPAKHDVLTLVVEDKPPVSDSLASVVDNVTPGFGLLATIIAFAIIYKKRR
jgi:hypothetical protein